MPKTPQQLKIDRNVRRYTRWYEGKRDAARNQGCRSANGDYLNGFYSGDAIIPEFLTANDAAQARRIMIQRRNQALQG